MPLEIPESMEIEHDELLEQMKAALDSKGKTAEAAKKISETLFPHFEKEEEYAMPLIGLLSDIAKGKPVKDPAKAIDFAERLEREHEMLLIEHKRISAAADELIAAAKKEKKEHFLEFAEKLKTHAQSEEEIIYPAAIVVGKFLKLQNK